MHVFPWPRMLWLGLETIPVCLSKELCLTQTGGCPSHLWPKAYDRFSDWEPERLSQIFFQPWVLGAKPNMFSMHEAVGLQGSVSGVQMLPLIVLY